MFYQAMQMGMAETVGLGWAKVDEYVDRVNAVNAGQIQRVVRRYFIDDHLSIATLDPLPIPKGSHIGEAAMSGGQHVR
jgi:zinc protease